MPSSDGPAPDQHAASAPASTGAEQRRAPRGRARCGRAGGCGRPWPPRRDPPVGQAGQQQRHAAQIEHRVGARRLGQHLACRGVARLRSGTMATKASWGERQRRVDGPALDRRRRDQPPDRWPPRSRDARRGRRPPRRDPRSGRGRGRRGQRRRGAQAAGDRYLRAHRDGDAVVAGTSIATRAARCDASSKSPAPSPSCARAARPRARPRRSRSGRAPPPACRSPVRGWPTRPGPGPHAVGYRA